MSEKTIQNEILLAASEAGYTLWRNNTGTAWQGRAKGRETTPDGVLLVLENPRPVKFGLCEGSSDLIGLRPVRILPQMVGQTIAQFVAIEVKSKRGRTSEKQDQFLRFVEEHGGVAVVARCIGDITGDET